MTQETTSSTMSLEPIPSLCAPAATAAMSVDFKFVACGLETRWWWYHSSWWCWSRNEQAISKLVQSPTSCDVGLWTELKSSSILISTSTWTTTTFVSSPHERNNWHGGSDDWHTTTKRAQETLSTVTTSLESLVSFFFSYLFLFYLLITTTTATTPMTPTTNNGKNQESTHDTCPNDGKPSFGPQVRTFYFFVFFFITN